MSEIIRDITTKRIIQREFNYDTASVETRNYRDKVYADGGIILNPLLVEYAFQTIALLTFKLGRTPLWVNWIDTAFGVKIDSSNRVLKVYDLLGLNDYIPVGNITTSPLLVKDSQGLFNFSFDGINDGLTSQNSIVWNTDKCTAVVVNTSVYVFKGTIIDSSNGTNNWRLRCTNITGQKGVRINQGLPNYNVKLGSYTNNSIEIESFIVDNSIVGPGKIIYLINNIEMTTSVSPADVSGSFSDGKINYFGNVEGVYLSGTIYGSLVLKEALSPANTKLLADFYNRIHNLY